MRESRAIDADAAVEFFPALEQIAGLRHAFVRRIPRLDVVTDRAEALARLEAAHRRVREKLGLAGFPFATAEQVHGNAVAEVGALTQDRCFEAADALITDRPHVSLGIYVADCCAVYLVDPLRRAIGLAHSGRKGTELGIVTKAIARMSECYDSDPANLVVQFSPCIRPPHYEVDFAAEIRRQAAVAGVRQIVDPGVCTACDLSRYYSYRLEKGRTGRMLALLSLARPATPEKAGTSD